MSSSGRSTDLGTIHGLEDHNRSLSRRTSAPAWSRVAATTAASAVVLAIGYFSYGDRNPSPHVAAAVKTSEADGLRHEPAMRANSTGPGSMSNRSESGAAAGLLINPTMIAGSALALSPSTLERSVDNIKIVSDAVEDVTTLESWTRAFIKPGMSDRDKAIAIWTSVVKFRHQDIPPNEWMESEGNVRDPIKTFNVYGYGMCSCASSNIISLARSVGLKARGKGISFHSVPEVYYEDDWHLLDASLICYFPDAKGSASSVDEIVSSVREWYGRTPGYEGNGDALMRFMRDNGWKKGPEALARSPFYGPNGWLPAATHGWYSTMIEYDGKNNFDYEYGYSMGYRALFSLRRGERLVRNWSNTGLHVNMYDGGAPGALEEKVGRGDMKYATAYGDLGPGRIGNGKLTYEVPLKERDWQLGAWQLENVADGAGLKTDRRKRSSSAIFRIDCPYVFLKSRIRVGGRLRGGGAIRALLSTNNGLDYAEVWKREAPGVFSEEIDLERRTLRRYDYYLKLELNEEASVDTLAFDNDIQHSQRALPSLKKGVNNITVTGGEPVKTITVAGALDGNCKDRNELITSYHPEIVLMRQGGGLWCTDYGKPGLVTFPIETPGDIKSVRFGGHFRARDRKDGVDLLLSFDGGTTWLEAGEAHGPYAGYCTYVEYDKVPRGARKVLVRYRVIQRGNTAGIFNLRIDVDYWNTGNGKPSETQSERPLRVTYVWTEGGLEKRDVHVTRRLAERYTITCKAEPTMKALIVEQEKQ